MDNSETPFTPLYEKSPDGTIHKSIFHPDGYSPLPEFVEQPDGSLTPSVFKIQNDNGWNSGNVK